MNANTKEALCEFAAATTEAFLILSDQDKTFVGSQFIKESKRRVMDANKALKVAVGLDETEPDFGAFRALQEDKL